MDILSDRLLPIFESAREVYKLYGREENVSYFLDRDAGHTYSKPMRLVMYGWFNKWLKGIDNPSEAREPRDPEDFPVNKESGLLKLFSPGEKGTDIIDLEREYLTKNKVRFDPPSNPAEVVTFQERMKTRLVDLMGTWNRLKSRSK